MTVKQYFTTNEMSLLSGLDVSIISQLGNKKNKVLTKISRGNFDWQSVIIARTMYHFRKTWRNNLSLNSRFKGFINYNHLDNNTVIIIYQNKIKNVQLTEFFINYKESSLKEIFSIYNTCEYCIVDDFAKTTDLRNLDQTTDTFLFENNNNPNLGLSVFVAKIVIELWELGYKYKIPNFAKKADFAPISFEKDIILENDLMLIG